MLIAETLQQWEDKRKNKKMEEEKLIGLVERLSPEGRARAISDMALKTKIPETLFTEARDFYHENKFDYGTHSIAFLAKATNKLEETIRHYEEIGDLVTASGVAENAGEREKAIEILVKMKHYHCAAGLAEACGWVDRAIDLYLKSYNDNSCWKKTSIDDAINLAEKHQRKEKVLEICELANYWNPAIKVAEELKLFDRVKSLKEKAMAEYESKEKYSDAAKIAEELGKTEKAQSLWKKELTILLDSAMRYDTPNRSNSEYKSASKIALKLGDKKLALELRIKARCDDSGSLGEFAEELGFYEKAIEFFEGYEYGKLSCARAAEKAGMLEKALDIYRKIASSSKEFIEAARIAKRLGYTKTSQDLYEKAIGKEQKDADKYAHDRHDREERLGKAAEIAFEADDIDKAISLYSETQRYREKAYKLAKENGRIRTAIAIYTCDTPEYLEQAAKLAEEHKMLTDAMKLYSKSLELNESKWNFLGAARIARHLGLEQKAKDNYEKARIMHEKKGNWKICLEIAKETDDKERKEAYEMLLEK